MICTTIAFAALAQTAKAPATPALAAKRTKTFEGLRTVAVAAAPTGTRFAACLENGQVKIMDAKTATGLLTLTGHPQSAYAVTFSPDGKQILTGDETGRIFLWDSKSGKKLKEFLRDKAHKRGIQALAFSPDGKNFVSVGKDDFMFVWSIAGSHPVKSIPGNTANFAGAYFTPAGALVTATLKEGARIYAPKTFALAATLTLPGGQGANSLAVNKLGTLAVTFGRDGKVALWDLKTKQRAASLSGHEDWVMAGAISPNGRVIATSSNDMTVRLWDVKSRKEVVKIERQSPIGSPVVFTADGNFLISTSDSDFVTIYAITPKQA